MTENEVQEKKADKKQSTKDLEAKIAELEAKVAAGEEAALQRVCSAFKIDPASLNQKSLENHEMVECVVPYPVRVNTQVYQGRVKVTRSTFEVIQQALGDRRMRLLREMTGDNNIIDELSAGPFTARKVGSINADGERIA